MTEPSMPSSYWESWDDIHRAIPSTTDYAMALMAAVQSGRLGPAAPAQPQPKESTMIEVAKIVTQTSVVVMHGMRNPIHRNHDDEIVRISMDATGVALQLTKSYQHSEDHTVTLTIEDPKKVIEIAQLLMKAAESQTDYSAAAKALADQKAKLDANFKDRVSGLGLNSSTASDMLVVYSQDGDK